MCPTKDRNVQSMALTYKGEIILIDCGEGTQRQMSIAKIPKSKIKKILISHWHGDHVSGLIGLLQTAFNQNYEGTMRIYGPKGTKMHMDHMLKTVVFESELDIEVIELTPKKNELIKFYENENYYLQCALLEHGTICLGYSFVEKKRYKISMAKAEKLGIKEGPNLGKIQKGESVIINGKTINPEDISKVVPEKKITIISDTCAVPEINLLAKNSDLLISEATFTSEFEERARETKHMTAAQIAQIALDSNAKKLLVTHFSQRFKTSDKILEDAKLHFKEVEAAYDFMKLKVN